MAVQLTIEDLNRYCVEREEESTTLEFKSCNEMIPGTPMRQDQNRSLDDIKEELSKDVSAMLNSAGGTIIYGIRENKSRASKLDSGNAFSRADKRNIRPEQVTQWIRAHVQPPPTVDAYRISIDEDNPDNGWFIVIDVPQGQTAYRAKDGRFYKRVVSTLQIMEQYEVADVMNRLKGADLVTRVSLEHSPTDAYPRHELFQFSIRIELSSLNMVASEYGALKLSTALPLDWSNDKGAFRTADLRNNDQFPSLVGSLCPKARSAMLRWGANQGIIIFPGVWYDFGGRLFNFMAPSRRTIAWPTYIFQIELFTNYSASKTEQFAIRRIQPESGDQSIFQLARIDDTNRAEIEETFSQTYAEAGKKNIV